MCDGDSARAVPEVFLSLLWWRFWRCIDRNLALMWTDSRPHFNNHRHQPPSSSQVSQYDSRQKLLQYKRMEINLRAGSVPTYCLLLKCPPERGLLLFLHEHLMAQLAAFLPFCLACDLSTVASSLMGLHCQSNLCAPSRLSLCLQTGNH